MNGDDACKKETPISKEVERLERAKEGLITITNQLEVALKPVLHPKNPSPTTDGEKDSVSTPLVAQLKSICDHLTTTKGVLQDMYERLGV